MRDCSAERLSTSVGGVWVHFDQSVSAILPIAGHQARHCHVSLSLASSNTAQGMLYSLGQVFNSKLAHYLNLYAPTADLHKLVQSSEAVWDESITPAALRPMVIQAYVKALNWVYIVGVPLGIVAILGGFIMCALFSSN